MKPQAHWTTIIVVFIFLVLACASCEPSNLPERVGTSIPSGNASVDEPPITPSTDEPTPTALLLVQPTATTGQEPAASTEIPVIVEELPAEEPTKIPEPSQDINTAFILDASGSMLAALSGRTRLAIAQDAIGNLSAGLPASINASLWVYGHRVEKNNQAEIFSGY